MQDGRRGAQAGPAGGGSNRASADLCSGVTVSGESRSDYAWLDVRTAGLNGDRSTNSRRWIGNDRQPISDH